MIAKDYTLCEVKSWRHSSTKEILWMHLPLYDNTIHTKFNLSSWLLYGGWIHSIQCMWVWAWWWHFQSGSLFYYQYICNNRSEREVLDGMLCGFGRVLQTVLVSTYESKDDWDDVWRIGRVVLIYFLNFVKLNWWSRPGIIQYRCMWNVGACENVGAELMVDGNM